MFALLQLILCYQIASFLALSLVIIPTTYIADRQLFKASNIAAVK